MALYYSACDSGESPSQKVAAEQDSLTVLAPASAVTSSSDDALKKSNDGKRAALLVTQIDEVANEEGGVVFRGVDSLSPPGPHLHDTILYADVRALAYTLAPHAQLVVQGTAVRIDDRPLSLPAHQHGPALYVAVKPFARAFGAYAQRMDQSGSTTIWPRDVLEYLVKERNSDPPVVQEARAEGLPLPP